MSAAPVETQWPPRLSPFAFPPDTTLRFILLFVFVIAAVIRRWHGVAVIGFDFDARLKDCLDGAPLIDAAALLDVAKRQECYRPLLASEILAIGLGLVLLAVVTGAIYWCYPIWVIRRKRLTPLDPTDAPELFATLRELCNIAGLQRHPQFWWNPVNSSRIALAFGRARSYRVGLAGGLAALHYSDQDTDRGAFRAVMLHELAHIRNGDVEKTYVAMALWPGFLLVALLPYLVVAGIRQMDMADSSALLVEATIVTGIVFLTRNAVLRARELYADARSFTWGRDETGFDRVLGGLSPVPWLKRLFSRHPDPARRRRLLDNTDEMFRFGFWDALGAGAAASLIAITSAFVAGLGFLQVHPESNNAIFALLVIPVAIVVPLVAGVASIVAWRTNFLALMRGKSPDGVVRTACGLAAGFVLCAPTLYGALVLQAAMGGPGRQYVDQLAVPWSSLIFGALAFIAILIVVLAGILVLFLKWVEAGATTWLSVTLCMSSPRVAFRLGIVFSCVLAVAWFSLGYMIFGSASLTLHDGGRSNALSILWYTLRAVANFPLNPIAWVSLIAFWALPLTAGLWRLSTGTQVLAEWPFLDSAVRMVSLMDSPLRLRRALLIGCAGGLTAAVLLPWLLFPLPAGALRDVGYSETANAAALLSMTITCMVTQGVIAALVVIVIPKLPIPHAMFAAFVAGWILAGAEMLHLLTRGEAMGIALDLVLVPVLFGGSLFSLVAALTTLVLRLPVHALLARLPRGREYAVTEQLACPQGAGPTPQRRKAK